MLILKKIPLIFFSRSLCYFLQMYKLKSIFLKVSLLKKSIWSWPIIINKTKVNLYSSFF
jgi:hypothetical protein